MFSTLSKLICKLIGWNMVFDAPFPEPRGVIVVYPHTSNWDFPLGLLWKSFYKVSPRWVGKESLFQPAPVGWVMRKLGGIGIKREGNLDVTHNLRKAMLAEKECWLVMPIEGTRGYKPYIHMGYYYIAKAANVPIALSRFDYKTKTVSVGEYRRIKDTLEEEIVQLQIDFAQHNAKYPESAGALALKEKKANATAVQSE